MPVSAPVVASSRTSHLVLLSLDWIRPKDPRTSLGHASLIARLREVNGLAVVPLSFAVNEDGFDREGVLLAVLASTRADSDFAVGAYVWNDAVVRWLLPALRRAGFTGRIILGGPQVSYAPAGIDEVYPEADVFIRGYAEDALAGLFSGPGVRTGVTRRGADHSGSPAVVDLASLPSPVLAGVLPPTRFVRWETQRGCVYRCSFCQHRESGARLRQNVFARERILAEVDAFVRDGVRDIAVLDPIFESNPDAIDILARFRAARFPGRLSLQCRFEGMTSQFLDACEGLDVRLEFGLQTTQRSEMRAISRMNDLGKVDAAIRELRRRKIIFEVSLIYGLPTQTVESFRASIRWCRALGVDTIKAFPLMLLRGTEMERSRARWALAESDDVIPVVVESNSFSREDWRCMKALAEALEVPVSPTTRGTGGPRGARLGSLARAGGSASQGMLRAVRVAAGIAAP